MLSTVSRDRGRSSFEEKSSTTFRHFRLESAEIIHDVLIAYLVVQSLHARYSTCLLERVDFNSRLVRYGLEVLVDIVQDLAVHLQRLDNLLVRVLQDQTSKVRRDFAPSRRCTPPMGRTEEDDQLRTRATGIRSVYRL